jgi:hypothetical protein
MRDLDEIECFVPIYGTLHGAFMILAGAGLRADVRR